jgi:hypothetical protein
VALHRQRAVAAVRWADRALVGSAVASVVTVAASAALVARADAPTYLWGLLGPTRTGSPPLEFHVAGADVMVLVVALMVIPPVLAAVGRTRTRDVAGDVRQHRPAPLSVWSQAGAVSAAALLPNVLGCLWLSAIRPLSSDLFFFPEVWPYVAVVFLPLAWEMVDRPRRRAAVPPATADAP